MFTSSNSIDRDPHSFPTRRSSDLFDWEVRQHIVDHNCHWEDWSRIHRLAHEKGMKTPATMLYGHIEEPRHRVDHVIDRKSTRLNSSHSQTSYAVFCLQKKKLTST